MALSNLQSSNVAEVLRTSLLYKLENYKPEPNSMPFQTRLLGKDRLALFSFIQSLNTNFGTTIYEPVAIEIAKPFFDAKHQAVAGNKISQDAQHEIQSIIDDLTKAETMPNKSLEIERISKVCSSGKMVTVKPTKVDLLLKDRNNGELFLFDIKTAKPNIGDFQKFKRTLLEWVAVVLVDNPGVKVNTMIAIPYNPYDPKPYNRWTIRGMLDLDHELLVAEGFWDFLGGKGTYDELLDIFEKIGIELRPELDRAFAKFK